MSETFVEPDAVDGLAAELLALAAGLSDEADECRRGAGLLGSAAAGQVASAASGAAESWSQAVDGLAQLVSAFSAALYQVAGEYRSVDAALASDVGGATAGGPR